MAIERLSLSNNAVRYRLDGHDETLAFSTGNDARKVWELLRRITDAQEIEHFWTALANGWDIEPRAYFEKEAVAMGFKSPIEMAVHWMWKRHAKDWPNEKLAPTWFCQQCSETFTDTRIAAAHSRHTYHVITSERPITRGAAHARSEDA